MLTLLPVNIAEVLHIPVIQDHSTARKQWTLITDYVLVDIITLAMAGSSWLLSPFTSCLQIIFLQQHVTLSPHCWMLLMAMLPDTLTKVPNLGAMLDQLTDRCGTLGLVTVLAHFYPKYMFWFILSMCIDVSCHWIYLHSSILQGKSSHKFIDMSENPIMSIYYTNKTVLFIMCAGNEAFYATLYLLHFTEGPIVVGLSLFRIILYLSAPISLVKTGISLLHCVVASKNLAIIDTNERKNAMKKAN
ncbi:hypothetical protein NQ314_014542 [Rhamnusium bicolor]|uniref:CDP-diacylglycerol--inositol 3-phosphatidyltransferase n=1 Tax=Rhamnusium bicolor TaxID=1586634 RepID=A0AAV8X1R0_9CUCU|nr:hypothetical protein NQ314_014542 [Rhamnusium bicolor]